MTQSESAASIRTLVSLGGLLLLLSSCVVASKPPNVVLVSVDTLSFAALRAFAPGANAHPYLDEFARKGRVFTAAHAAASWTLPSQASLLTGTYPDRHGAIARGQQIRDDAPRLATVLAEQGFATVAFTDAGFVHHSLGFNKGFGRYDEWASAPEWGKFRFPRNGYPHKLKGSALFDRGIAFLGLLTDEAPPFFMYLQTYAVHDYFASHPWTKQVWEAVPRQEPGYYVSCLVGKTQCNKAEWELLESLYHAEIQHLDNAFGRLLDALSQAGVRESTVVIVVSDHGEAFDLANGRIHHGGRLHADQLRVPLMLQGPGVTPGISSEPVSLVDVMPTVLDWLNIPTPEGLDGHSLAAALQGGPLETRPLYAFEYAHRWEDGRRLDLEAETQPVLRAVIGEDLWYIEDARADELYRTADDPEQIHNLAAESNLDAVRQLASRRGNLGSKVAPEPLTEELEEQLQALGYLE